MTRGMESAGSASRRTLSLCAAAVFTCSALLGQPADPKQASSAQLQQQYVTDVSQQIESVVKSMSTELFPSDPFFTSRTALHPGGKVAALALSREQSGENRWAVLILDKSTLEVSQVYDFLRAYHLNRMEWSPDGGCLLVLAEDVALSGPPATLALIDTKSKRAYVVDRNVWQYTLSPDGKELVYERCEKADQTLGRREIRRVGFAKLLETLRDPTLTAEKTLKEHVAILRAGTGLPALSLDYPREQLEGFKSWSSDSTTLHMSVYRYGPGATQPARARMALDCATGKTEELK